jgi:hypothetical protein
VAGRRDDLLTHNKTFLPKNLSPHGEKASMNCPIATKKTAHAVTTGYVAETGLNRPKNSDKLSVRHDFYPVKRHDAKPLFKLPVGRYYVTVKHGSAYASTEVKVTAAQVVSQTLNLNAGYLRLSSILAQGTEPLTDDLRYDVYEAKQDVTGERKRIEYSTDAKPLFKLPIGSCT